MALWAHFSDLPFAALLLGMTCHWLGRADGGSMHTLDAECMEARPGGLCVVNVTNHVFAPPNKLIAEETRGVYWIDAGDKKGFTNPWVDLNFLSPFPAGSKQEGKFYVMDASPKYQSWVDVSESITYVEKLKWFHTRSEVDPTNLLVTWSACGFTCGTRFETWVPLPVSSPSEKIGENEYIRKAVVFGRTISSWKGYRIVDGQGRRTPFFDKMVRSVGDSVLMIPEAAKNSQLALIS